VTVARYLAFLRAVNVGGRTVKMDHLRKTFERLGFNSVDTFIASGNVIFEATGPEATLERTIEASLENTFGFAIPTVLRTPAELARALDASPFAGEGAGALYVGFAARRFPAAAAGRIAALQTDVDAFAVKGRDVYWRALAGMGQSAVSGAAVEKALGAPVTFRSVTTLRKLALKCA
jgi:uncharacterized protein (DUF1697 family)